MKLSWRTLTVFLVVVMLISILGACGSSSDSSSTEEASSSEASSSNEDTLSVEEVSSSEEDAQEAESSEEIEEATDDVQPEESTLEVAGPESYYVAEETTTVSILYKFVNFFSPYWEDSSWASSPWWGALEEATNVQLELTLLSQDVFNEQMLLLCASGDLPDVVPEMGVVYATGFAGAIDDEVIYDLSPYFEEYAPNYYAYLQEYGEDTIRDVILDDGSAGAMYALYDQTPAIENGLWIRDDWLEQVNMDVPTTLDELYNVLKAFKTELGAENAMYAMVGMNTIAIEMTGIGESFGSPLGFYSYDGSVYCSYIEDSYYEYLSYLKMLADESLFITSDISPSEQAELMMSNQIGVYGENTSNIADQVASIDAEGASFKAMANPGDPTECGASDSMVAAFSVSISTNCDYPELVVKMFDYLYTEEGSMLASYGIEGVSFEYVDGEPMWTDLVTNNPTGAPYAGTSTYYLNPGFPALQIANIVETTYTEEYQREAASIWATSYSGNAKQSLDVSLTSEETDALSAYISDMNTYLTEQVYSWVFGGQDLDEASWNDYLETMESMQIDTILETYQTAYERYLTKEMK